MSIQCANALLITLILCACFSSPSLLPNPISTQSIPSLSYILTPNLDNVLSSSKTPEFPLGTPVSDWYSIPLSPFVVEGKPFLSGYIYSVDLTLKEVEVFYISQMNSTGWILLDRRNNEDDWHGNQSTSLFFKRKNELGNIIVFSAADGTTLVMLNYDISKDQ